MPTAHKLPDKPKDHKKNKYSDRIINEVTFFGDAAIPEDDEIYKLVFNTAKKLAKEGYTIVNGGGPGLMKAATDGAESVNGNTSVVYWEPKFASIFEGKNLANIADETDAQVNYINRTFGLIEQGDVYVVCKGGTGTVSEFGLVWALAKLYYGVHKPVILFGSFWKDLIESFKKNMYIDEKELSVLYFAETFEEVLNIIQNHEKRLDRTKLKLDYGEEGAFLLKPSEKITQESYEVDAHNYHSDLAGKLVAKEQLDDFISMVNSPARVLDIGCGPGYDAAYLSEKYTVTGIEISKRFAQIAKFENPHVNIKYGDITKIKLEDNYFKGIWARDSIHHIGKAEQNKLFHKLADALVEGGILYIIVREGKGELVEKEHKNYGKLERFYHLFDADELVQRAEKAGLELVKIDHKKRSHKWIVGVFKKK